MNIHPCSKVRVVALVMSLCFCIASAAAADIVLKVDTSAPSNGDCKNSPCWTITQAVQQARSERLNAPATPIVIRVAPGDYRGNYGATGGDPRTEDLPIVLDVSGLTLVGSTVLTLDSDGLPTGGFVSETRLESDSAMHAIQAVLAVAPTTDAVPLTNVTIRGMVLDAHNATNNGFANPLVLDRVTGIVVEGNIVLNGGPGIDALMTSGTFHQNYSTCNSDFGLAVSAGSAAHPATVSISQNRFVNNGLHGLVLSGSGFLLNVDYGKTKVIPVADGEIGDLLNATVSNNDLSDNGAFGVRQMAYSPRPSGDQHNGLIRASFSHNRIAGNRFGVVFESGFTWRAKSNPGPYSMAFVSSFDGDTIIDNTKFQTEIAFRNASWVNSGTPTSCFYQPLVNSTITITDPDGSLTGAQIDNPKFDPNFLFGAVCPSDVPPSGLALGNTLTINGAVVP
jgi:hypothetical protein